MAFYLKIIIFKTSLLSRRVFASDNETLKVIEAYESIETRRRRSLSKAFDGMDQHNAWDFETQYKQILFKLKLEDFKLKVKKPSRTQKRLSLAIILIIDLIYYT
jgi:ATP-binding cassette subfamily F protein uup